MSSSASALRSISNGLRRLSAQMERARVRMTSRRPAATKRLPASAFALPESRQFPVHDRDHAEAALLHLIRLGKRRRSPELARRVLASIRSKWPGLYRAEKVSVARAKRLHGVA